MGIKMIAIDLDGTLLNENHGLNTATIQAVKQAKVAGIKVVLCSGRPLSGVSQYFETLGLVDPGDYVISYNGAMVQHADTGDVLVQHTLTAKDFQDMAALAEELGVHIQALDEAKLYTPNADISKYTVRESYLVKMPLFYRKADTFDASKRFAKLMMIDEPGLLAEAKKNLPSECFDKYYIVNSEPFFLEIQNKAVNKGNAVKALADNLGYEMSEVMAVGDQANDIPMIKAAGIGVAMGNAAPEIIAAADVQTATNIEDGVAKAIVKYALNA